MEPLVFALMLVPALIASIAVSANAKKLNAAWRARRSTRSAERGGRAD